MTKLRPKTVLAEIRRKGLDPRDKAEWTGSKPPARNLHLLVVMLLCNPLHLSVGRT